MPRRKKQRDPEYTLHVFHQVDERTRKALQVFLVQTIKEFTSFNYEILLDASMDGRALELKILGLRTTPLIMPGVGPARGRRDFTGLRGSYDLSVMKPDGETNEFRLGITPSHITVEGTLPHPFIIVSNTPVTLFGS
jgi:hypothetical protein